MPLTEAWNVIGNWVEIEGLISEHTPLGSRWSPEGSWNTGICTDKLFSLSWGHGIRVLLVCLFAICFLHWLFLFIKLFICFSFSIRQLINSLSGQSLPCLHLSIPISSSGFWPRLHGSPATCMFILGNFAMLDSQQIVLVSCTCIQLGSKSMSCPKCPVFLWHNHFTYHQSQNFWKSFLTFSFPNI